MGSKQTWPTFMEGLRQFPFLTVWMAISAPWGFVSCYRYFRSDEMGMDRRSAREVAWSCVTDWPSHPVVNERNG